MKKSILIIRKRESEALILGNGREREFLLTPDEYVTEKNVTTSQSYYFAVLENDILQSLLQVVKEGEGGGRVYGGAG